MVMITEQEYNKWKPLIEEYEENLAADALANSLYCVSCQALEAHDCFCDGEDIEYCAFCQEEAPYHRGNCPYRTAEL